MLTSAYPSISVKSLCVRFVYAEGVSTPKALNSDSNFSNAAIAASTATVIVVEIFIFSVISWHWIAGSTEFWIDLHPSHNHELIYTRFPEFTKTSFRNTLGICPEKYSLPVWSVSTIKL